MDPDDSDFFDRDKKEIDYTDWKADIMKTFNYKTKRSLFKKCFGMVFANSIEL